MMKIQNTAWSQCFSTLFCTNAYSAGYDKVPS